MINKSVQDMLGNFVRVEQMRGHNGPVRNQFIIRFERGVIFQSYQTVIAAVIGFDKFLDVDAWDYSVTTGKYRNIFLGENKAQTEKRIKNGYYKMIDLNER